MRYIVAALIGMALFVIPVHADAAVWKTTTWVSTYSWEENSPPGPGIEYANNYGYPTVHNVAGGTGTYANPITFAAQSNQWWPGTRIYIPALQVYAMKEDLCSTCFTNTQQMDIWIGHDANYGDSHDMVNLWTQWRVIVNPPKGLRVNTTPLNKRRI